MSKRNAFLHHYTAYGMEKDELLEAEEYVKEKIGDYRFCDCDDEEEEEDFPEF